MAVGGNYDGIFLVVAVQKEFWFGCEIFTKRGRCSEIFISEDRVSLPGVFSRLPYGNNISDE